MLPRAITTLRTRRCARSYMIEKTISLPCYTALDVLRDPVLDAIVVLVLMGLALYIKWFLGVLIDRIPFKKKEKTVVVKTDQVLIGKIIPPARKKSGYKPAPSGDVKRPSYPETRN